MKKFTISFILVMMASLGYAQITPTSLNAAMTAPPADGCTYCYQWNRDIDQDGFGDPSNSVLSDTKPIGYVANQSDLDDTNPNITNITPQTFYRDADSDTFGSISTSVYYSVKPIGYVSNRMDCNDADAAINPNTKWYADNEGDGLGDPATFVQQCTKPVGNYVRDNSDNCPLVLGSSSDCNKAIAPTIDQNYIITKIYKKPTLTTFVAPTVDKAQTNITYFDGLGRPIQQIANAQSNTAKDIVTHIAYDAYGRQTQEFLPYASSQNTMAYIDGLTLKNNTISQYQTKYGDANPYSEKLFESSPLNRVVQQAAPGTDWALSNPLKHTIKIEYQTNTNADAVKRYTANATFPSAGVYNIALVDNGDYPISQLYKTITYDENTTATPVESAGSTVEFKNKEGQVILKRTYDNAIKHDTYYVYDQYGNLTYVLPPLVTAPATQLDDLCYQYKYDNRNRLVEKKLPGKQWEFIVYDKLDRVVATGPALSPFNNSAPGAVGWMITKYDVLNRPVYTGWELSTTVTSAGRLTKQNTMNGLTTISESKTTTATTIDALSGIAYYTNAVSPTTFKLLTINYYDNYTFKAFTPAIAYTAPIYYNNTTLKPKGLPTGSWVRTLTTLTSPTAESSYILYDAKARPIKTYTTNHLGGYTQTDSNLVAFSGQLISTETRHKRLTGDGELYTKEVFTYSDQDRLLTHTHQIGTGGTPQLLASNTYDELGQLIGKNVGNTITTPLQKVNYTYNIRGWMTEINKVAVLQQGTDPKDLFGFKINYNTIDGDATAANKLYNGNIAETSWSTSPVVRTYGYKYDNLNRLKDATYQKAGLTTKAYNENLTYDKNGNILTLKRNGDTDPQIQPITIDDLTYTYKSTSSNQLAKVTDNPTTATSGFKDGTNTNDDYTYDANGNLITDQNKGITAIVYNHLNLPTKITFGATGNIVYIYNAAGQKLEKIVTQGTTVTNTNYLGGYQYLKPFGGVWALQFFPTAEGYVKNTAQIYSYVFNYTDHLGNVRLSYSDADKNGTIATTEIVEETHYYPFGLKQMGYTPTAVTDNKYKLNSREYQEELGLNVTAMDFRMYDSAIGRFYGLDALSELTPSETPNHFGHNNPVFWSDPSGLWAYKAFGNADTSINITSNQWIASQRPSNSPTGQLDAMSLDKKNLVSSSQYGSWYRQKVGQRASHKKDNGDSDLEAITLENIYTNVFVPNTQSSAFDAIDVIDYGIGGLGEANGLAQRLWQGSSNASQWSAAYRASKTLGVGASSIKNGVNPGLNTAGRYLTYAAIGVTAIKIASTGQVHASDVVSLSMIALGASTFVVLGVTGIGPAIATAYFVADLISLATTNKSLGDHLDKAVGEPLIDFGYGGN